GRGDRAHRTRRRVQRRGRELSAVARRTRLLGSLGARFVLVTFAVALIAVLVTALVAVQVVQTVEQNQARQQLKAQAAALVASGRAAGGRVGVVGDRFAVVSPDGTVT